MYRNWDPAGVNQYPGAAGGGNCAHRSRTAPCSVLAALVLPAPKHKREPRADSPVSRTVPDRCQRPASAATTASRTATWMPVVQVKWREIF